MLKHCETNTKLDQLEDWFKLNHKLPEEVDRVLLKRFLKCTSDCIDESKELIELNYKLRNKYPQIFIDRDPQDEKAAMILATRDSIPLPGLTPEGHKIFCGRMTDYDPTKINNLEEVKIFFMTADCRFTMSDVDGGEEIVADGDIQILDLSGYTLSHLARGSLSIARIVTKFLQEAYPLPLKGIHIINCPSFLDKLKGILKLFCNDEVYNTIHFHTNGLDSLYEYIPRDMLPEEYGGKAGKMADIKAKWIGILNEKRNYLMDPKHWKVEQPEENKNRWLFF